MKSIFKKCEWIEKELEIFYEKLNVQETIHFLNWMESHY